MKAPYDGEDDMTLWGHYVHQHWNNGGWHWCRWHLGWRQA